MNEQSAKLTRLGFKIECGSPVGELRHDNWPCITYTTTLFFDGKPVWRGPYSLGIGHVDLSKHTSRWWLLDSDESIFFEYWQRNQHANFKNKDLQARVAGKIAKHQKVQPELADVLHSLLLDGEAYFSASSFDDWCAEFGYEPDSIKAKEVFDACDKTGRELARNVPQEALEKARGILVDY